MKIAGDPDPTTDAKRRAPLRAAPGAESAPHPALVREREALIDEAVELFGSRYRRTIGREEARRMIERLTAFVNLLAEWQDRAQAGAGEGKVAA